MEFLKKAKNEFGFNNVWTVDGQKFCYDEVAKNVKVCFNYLLWLLALCKT